MSIDAWIPIGFTLPDGTTIARVRSAGPDWQIYALPQPGAALIVERALALRWLDTGLLQESDVQLVAFGHLELAAIVSNGSSLVMPLRNARPPRSVRQAAAFAASLGESRRIDAESGFQGAIYVESLGRLLPTEPGPPRVPDDIVLGTWLTGGVPQSAAAVSDVIRIASWLDRDHIERMLAMAGLQPQERLTARRVEGVDATGGGARRAHQPIGDRRFDLPGRAELTRFFNEHIVDVLRDPERYRVLGIGFPAPVVLHGPPGSGKTHAVDRLADFLSWPVMAVDASSVGSPYIHETGRKIANLFDQARRQAPAIVVIDEMDALLSERDAGDGVHRAEEVAEFLRLIPAAPSQRVLVLAMTNRIEAIDPAVLRRGRFDHVVHVDVASKDDIVTMLRASLAKIPHDETVDIDRAASMLTGRPLSDVDFLIRDAARRAARAGQSQLMAEYFAAAIDEVANRPAVGQKRRIGFR